MLNVNDATEYSVVRLKILNSIPWSALHTLLGQIRDAPPSPTHPTTIWAMAFKHCMGGHSVDGEQGS